LKSLLASLAYSIPKVEAKTTKKNQKKIGIKLRLRKACQRLIEMRTNEGNELAIAFACWWQIY